MSKIPYVERCKVSTGLKGECAYLWTLFLANEADMRDDYVAYDKWKAMSETLQPKPGRAVPSSVHIQDLENEIRKYYDKRIRE